MFASAELAAQHDSAVTDEGADVADDQRIAMKQRHEAQGDMIRPHTKSLREGDAIGPDIGMTEQNAIRPARGTGRVAQQDRKPLSEAIDSTLRTLLHIQIK